MLSLSVSWTGLIFVDGLLWQEQRRFTLRHLRDLGFGKTCIEDQMMDEIRDLIRDMTNSAQSNADRVVEFRGTFTVSVVNILWAIIAGQRFQRDDAALKKLLENVDLFLKSGNIARTSLPVPEFLVRHVPIIPALLGVDTRLFQPLQQLIQVIFIILPYYKKGNAHLNWSTTMCLFNRKPSMSI